MQHILNLISDDRYIQHQAYQFLKNKWPQLNDTTKISYTNQGVIRIVELPPMNLFDSMKRVAISGWQRLKAIANKPTLKQLENPDERIAYSHRLWGAIFRLPMYAIWRMRGDSRGTELVPDPAVRMPPVYRREIRLESLGFQMDYPSYNREHRYRENSAMRAYIHCGYDGTTDTFYVYKR